MSSFSGILGAKNQYGRWVPEQALGEGLSQVLLMYSKNLFQTWLTWQELNVKAIAGQALQRSGNPWVLNWCFFPLFQVRVPSCFIRENLSGCIHFDLGKFRHICKNSTWNCFVIFTNFLFEIQQIQNRKLFCLIFKNPFEQILQFPSAFTEAFLSSPNYAWVPSTNTSTVKATIFTFASSSAWVPGVESTSSGGSTVDFSQALFKYKEYTIYTKAMGVTCSICSINLSAHGLNLTTKV